MVIVNHIFTILYDSPHISCASRLLSNWYNVLSSIGVAFGVSLGTCHVRLVSFNSPIHFPRPALRNGLAMFGVLSLTCISW